MEFKQCERCGKDLPVSVTDKVISCLFCGKDHEVSNERFSSSNSKGYKPSDTGISGVVIGSSCSGSSGGDC